MNTESRDQRYVEYHRLVASGVAKSHAAVRAGYHPMYRPRLNNALLEELESAGLTEKRFAKKLKEGINAKTDGGRPDHRSRLGYLNLWSRIKGYVVPTDVNLNIGLAAVGGVIEDQSRVQVAMDMIEAEIVGRETGEIEAGDNAQRSTVAGPADAGIPAVANP